MRPPLARFRSAVLGPLTALVLALGLVVGGQSAPTVQALTGNGGSPSPGPTPTPSGQADPAGSSGSGNDSTTIAIAIVIAAIIIGGFIAFGLRRQKPGGQPGPSG